MSKKIIFFFCFIVLLAINVEKVFSQVLDKEIILIIGNEGDFLGIDKTLSFVFNVSVISDDKVMNDFINGLKGSENVSDVSTSKDIIGNQKNVTITFSKPVDKSYIKKIFTDNKVLGIVFNNRFRFIENIMENDYYSIAPQPNTLVWYNKRIEDIVTKVLWVKKNPEEYNKVKENGWIKQADDAYLKGLKDRARFLGQVE